MFESITGTALQYGSSTANLIGTLQSVTKAYTIGARIKITGKLRVDAPLSLVIYHECTSSTIDPASPLPVITYTQYNLAAINSVGIKQYFKEKSNVANCFSYGFFDTGGVAIT